MVDDPCYEAAQTVAHRQDDVGQKTSQIPRFAASQVEAGIRAGQIPRSMDKWNGGSNNDGEKLRCGVCGSAWASGEKSFGLEYTASQR